MTGMKKPPFGGLIIGTGFRCSLSFGIDRGFHGGVSCVTQGVFYARIGGQNPELLSKGSVVYCSFLFFYKRFQTFRQNDCIVHIVRITLLPGLRKTTMRVQGG